LLGFAAGAGTFFGGWAPATADAQIGQTPGRRVGGGVLAGSAGGLLAGTLAAPYVEVPMDATINAAGLGLVLGGAGAGASAMVTQDDGVVVTTMLSSAGAGMLAGGLLHESISLDPAVAPTLAVGTTMPPTSRGASA
jgi:hypothetical protein